MNQINQINQLNQRTPAFPQFHEPVTRADDPDFLGLAVGAVRDGDGPQAQTIAILVSVSAPGRQPVRAGAQVAVPLAVLQPAR